MRPLLPADLDLAARVLLALPAARRRAEMDVLLQHAIEAETFRQATGRVHPGHGDGSLLSIALGRPRARPACADREYRRCLGIVLERISLSEQVDQGL
jgi:hypothetical protein